MDKHFFIRYSFIFHNWNIEIKTINLFTIITIKQQTRYKLFSFTSKNNILELDKLPYDTKEKCSGKFSGKRIHRGLYKSKNSTQSTLILRTEPIFCTNVNRKSILKNCFLGFWQAREHNSPLAAKLFLNPIRFSLWVRHNVDFLWFLYFWYLFGIDITIMECSAYIAIPFPNAYFFRSGLFSAAHRIELWRCVPFVNPYKVFPLSWSLYFKKSRNIP